jgi:Fic family protein
MILPQPLTETIETQKVLKKAISANRALANLNGVARIIPNSAILINSLVLQESKDSSAIENIITTHRVSIHFMMAMGEQVGL